MPRVLSLPQLTERELQSCCYCCYPCCCFLLTLVVVVVVVTACGQSCGTGRQPFRSASLFILLVTRLLLTSWTGCSDAEHVLSFSDSLVHVRSPDWAMPQVQSPLIHGSPWRLIRDLKARERQAPTNAEASSCCVTTKSICSGASRKLCKAKSAGLQTTCNRFRSCSRHRYLRSRPRCFCCAMPAKAN